VLEKCPHCDRTFRPESLKFHQKACTAERPLKPLKRNKSPLEEEKVPNLGLQARTIAEEK
jgi:hypothetical protein